MERRLMMDANQVWDVPEAIEKTLALAEFEPYWMEEPTSPDDALGHAAIAEAIAPIKVATGEHCMNRVLFKQLMQANAIGVCQVDACRLGGVNEVLSVLLLAAHYGVPVCPHSGGVGLCELTQHLSIVDYICVGASLDGRLLEYVDHLHEHFVDPVRMRGGRYLAPEQPGYSAQIKAESLDEFEFPGRRRVEVVIATPMRPRGCPAHRGRGRRRAHLPARAAADRALERRHHRRGRRRRSTTRAGRTRSSAPRSCSASPAARARGSSTSCAARRACSGSRPATPAPASSSAPRSRSPPTSSTASPSRPPPASTPDRSPSSPSSACSRSPRTCRSCCATSASATGRPASSPVGELRDQTLLLVGVGAIGTETARLASAFGMHVIAVKRSLEGGVPHVDELHPVSELRSLVARADGIVITLPATDATRGLLDADTLAAVKPGAVLVNVGRGAVVDEAALAERLQDGTLAGAALDVFAEEPLPEDSPLWGLENVIVSPHNVALVEAEEPRIVDLFIDNLRRRRAGQPLRNALDPEVLY